MCNSCQPRYARVPPASPRGSDAGIPQSSQSRTEFRCHPVHISEICVALGVPRRSLHRAFNEVFGMGPVTFLRHKRLCAIHSILRESIPGTTTVATVAMQQGFYELGRFSHYYHAMFGEYPSQTLGVPARELAPQQP
jgi:transcriptional regulator GlxA family with amidase domain